MPCVAGSRIGKMTHNCAKRAYRKCQDPIFPGFSPNLLVPLEKTLTPQWRASDPDGSCHGIGTSEASAAVGGDWAPRARLGGPSPYPGSLDPGSCCSGMAGNPGKTSCDPSGPKAVERGKMGRDDPHSALMLIPVGTQRQRSPLHQSIFPQLSWIPGKKSQA